MSTNLLTEPEAARLLRCSPSKIKRLRLTGQLVYVPGRPVLIDETDLADFLAKSKRNARPEDASTTLSAPERPIEDARAWALRSITKRPR